MRNSRFGILAPLMFGARAGNSGPVIQNPEISFLAASLDPRVRFSGPAHSYLSQDGTIKQSAANEWPLQYIAGSAVGRHEPERASTNYQPSTNFESIASLGPTEDWVYSGGTTVTVSDSSIGVKAAMSNPGSIFIALYSEVSAWIQQQLDPGDAGPWQSVMLKGSLPAASALRWYTARQGSALYLYGRTKAVPAGPVVASCYRKRSATSVDTALSQVEPGANRTSPIITGVGVTGSRAAMSAYIDEPLASSATVTFSNGSSVKLQAEAGRITIPVTTSDWSTRFITKILMEQ